VSLLDLIEREAAKLGYHADALRRDYAFSDVWGEDERPRSSRTGFLLGKFLRINLRAGSRNSHQTRFHISLQSGIPAGRLREFIGRSRLVILSQKRS
jgi:hypothetical protein